MKATIKKNLNWIKHIGLFASAVLFLLTINATSVKAENAQLTGNGSARAGDTITVSFVVSGTDISMLSGTLNYDSNQLQYISASTMDGWDTTWQGNRFLSEDKNFTHKINGSSTVMTISFKLKDNVSTGSSINVSITGLEGVNADDFTMGDANYSVSVAAPLSSNTNLSALSVNGLTLSPAFSAGTKNYNVGEVEFATSRLTINATAEDAKSTVRIGDTDLAVGENTISVTVRAENGDSSTYTITVTRQQDPNYKASSDASLLSINLSAGSLSPVFSSDKKEYIVYLPFEAKGTSFTANGKTKDEKALGVTAGSIEALAEGNNKVTVIGKAEDGSTSEYVINVYVMPEFAGMGGSVGQIDMPGKDTQDTESTENTEVKTETEIVKVKEKQGVSVAAFVISILIMLAIGGFAGYLLHANWSTFEPLFNSRKTMQRRKAAIPRTDMTIEEVQPSSPDDFIVDFSTEKEEPRKKREEEEHFAEVNEKKIEKEKIKNIIDDDEFVRTLFDDVKK